VLAALKSIISHYSCWSLKAGTRLDMTSQRGQLRWPTNTDLWLPPPLPQTLFIFHVEKS
jgi:hypothetical protein